MKNEVTKTPTKTKKQPKSKKRLKTNNPARTWTLCPFQCPAGTKCGLRGDLEHEYHICKNPDCKCHDQQTYVKLKRQSIKGKAKK